MSLVCQRCRYIFKTFWKDTIKGASNLILGEVDLNPLLDTPPHFIDIR